MNIKAFIILFSAALLLISCAGTTDRPHSKSGLYFDTIISIDIYDPVSDADRVLDECMDLCSHYQALFDRKVPTSDIARISSGKAGTVSVDPDTASLLTEALKYCRLSEGRFDITIAPVSSLWDFHEGSEKIPDPAALREALSHVGYENIEVDTKASTVTVKADGISLDVGGAAKGYIADRIADHLKECGVGGAIINMGGDMMLIGHKSDRKLFNIGINDPDNPGGVAARLYVSDKAVATSGIYERSFISEGRTYHHILDVTNAYPVDTDIESVTVICDSAAASDCLCTVCTILGADGAQKLIEDLPDTEAVFILTDGSMRATSGAGTYLRQ